MKSKKIITEKKYSKRNKYLFYYLILSLILLLIPVFINNPYYLHIIILVYLNSLVALGLNMVTGLTGQVSIGQAAFFWLSCPIAGLVAAFFGLLLGFPVLKLRGPYLAFATIGFGEIVRLVLTNWYSLTKGPMGLTRIPSPTIFGVVKSFSLTHWYYLILAFLVITIICVNNIISSRIGRSLRALRDSQIGAAISGIDLSYYKILAFMLSAFVGGIGGSLYAHYITVISPEIFCFDLSFWYLCMIVIGGMGTVSGPILGAILLTILPEYLRFFKDYQMIIVGIVMILSVIFFSEGLVGIISSIKKYFSQSKNVVIAGRKSTSN
jgi:branched-chain amino acid transport system permease protein